MFNGSKSLGKAGFDILFEMPKVAASGILDNLPISTDMHYLYETYYVKRQ